MILSKWIRLAIFCILFLSPLPSNALEGTDIWEEGGYIDFEVTLLLDFNYDHEVNGEKWLFPYEFPSLDIKNADLKLSYIGINEITGDMVFQEFTSNEVLQDEIFEGESLETYQIDKMTGVDQEDNEPSYYFIDTSNWKMGFETQFIEDFDYEDDVGIHSETKHYIVNGESEMHIMINDSEKVIQLWDLGFNYDVSYTDGSLTWNEKYSGTMQVTKTEGIVMYDTVSYIINLNNVQAYEGSGEMKAKYLSNVNVDSTSSSSTDDSNGFTLGVISFIALLIVRQTRKYKSRNK